MEADVLGDSEFHLAWHVAPWVKLVNINIRGE